MCVTDDKRASFLWFMLSLCPQQIPVQGIKFLLKFSKINIRICHPIFSQRPSTIFESYDTSEVPTLTVPHRGSAGAVPTAADNNDGSV